MNKSILITGANGQLGSELRALQVLGQKTFEDSALHFTDVAELDITNSDEILKFCKENSISDIINCSAYTAVDKAEEDSDVANSINNYGVRNLAQVAKNLGIRLIHISTDYVFDGKGCIPYVETDDTNPLSVYGSTKLRGEKSIIDIAPLNAVIIRTSWIYSIYGNNFIKTMLRLGRERDELSVVYDQVGSPTSAKDLAEVILKIISSEEANDTEVQLYHYSNEGVCSWYDFAIEIFDILKINCKVKPITSDQFKTTAVRPSYSVLNKNKIKATFNLEIKHWKDSLTNTLGVPSKTDWLE